MADEVETVDADDADAVASNEEVIDDAGGPERILNQDEIDSLLGF